MKIIIPLCIGSSFDSCLYMLVLLSGIEAGGCPVQDGTFSIAHLEDGMYIVEAACHCGLKLEDDEAVLRERNWGGVNNNEVVVNGQSQDAELISRLG